MNHEDLMDEGRQVFAVESRELLQQMEDSLLHLESEPGDAESINSLFRAAHTIKGSAGLFAFDAIVAFTHVVESVLDRVRDGEVALDETLMGLLLPCCDHIGILVTEAIEDGRQPRPDLAAAGQELLTRLSVYLGAVASGAIASVSSGEGEGREGGEVRGRAADCVASDAWHISLRFGADVLRNGMDPLSFLQYLGTMGRIARIVTVSDRLPADECFDPESCYLGFEIRFESDAGKEAIEDVFDFVRSDCAIHVLPPHSRVRAYAELIAALPEPRERLGEILVECGALTGTELAGVLGARDAGGDAARAGDTLDEAGNAQPEVVDAALGKQRKIRAQRAEEGRFIRVEADKLDRLITLVGELVIAGAGTHLLAQRGEDSVLQESAAHLNHLTEEIRDEALRLRMVQIGETFNRFHRVVRDISRELGKDIGLSVSGADTELDKSVVERIGDPLMHLVRNSMDHGLEPTEQRVAAGKPARGQIALNAYHDSGSIVIEVSDDGRGLDRDRILAKARERGLVKADHSPAEEEIDNLIFAPGFSTAEQVTNLSGRGVGMDVVRSNIEALRGSVGISSSKGRGTTVSIRLPLTLAIIDGFLVEAGGATYVIPLDMIVECVELPADRLQGGDFLNVRGKVLPYLRLRDLFGIDGDRPVRESVVVVRYGQMRAGIVVDRLLGEAQTVIKPLGKLFSGLKGISGSSILGTGEVALILDVAALVQRAGNAAAVMPAPARPAAAVH